MEYLAMAFATVAIVFGMLSLYLSIKTKERNEEMATSLETLQAEVEEISVETTRIGEKFEEIIGQLLNGTITNEQITDLTDPLIERLKAIGAEPPPPTTEE